MSQKPQHVTKLPDMMLLHIEVFVSDLQWFATVSNSNNTCYKVNEGRHNWLCFDLFITQCDEIHHLFESGIICTTVFLHLQITSPAKLFDFRDATAPYQNLTLLSTSLHGVCFLCIAKSHHSIMIVLMKL